MHSRTPPPISVVMLTRDGAATLDRCLSSLADFAEVLVYDNGSTDTTLEIAARYRNVRIVKGHFDGFGPTRNRVDALARHDWVLKIDSDEWLSRELAAALLAAPLDDPSKVYTFILRNIMFGRVQRGLLGRQLVHRLYQRGHMHWVGSVHEYIERKDGEPMRTHFLPGLLWHDSYRSLGHMFQKRWYYAQPHLRRDRLQPAHPAVAALRALWRFLRCYIFQIGFIDGWRGFVLSVAEAYGTFLKYAWAYEERARNGIARPLEREKTELLPPQE